MVNKWIGIGNLGYDPEVRYTNSGTPVASFSIGCSEKYKDASGSWVEKTEWVNIVAWQKLAEICGEYLRKGSRVYIEGKLQTSKYTDRNGNERYKTEVNCKEMKMISPRSEGQRQESYSAPSTGSDVPYGDDPPF